LQLRLQPCECVLLHRRVETVRPGEELVATRLGRGSRPSGPSANFSFPLNL
jgi:regulator of protease activity HflC (stomatin/prohibitin superfamily)